VNRVALSPRYLITDIDPTTVPEMRTISGSADMSYIPACVAYAPTRDSGSPGQSREPIQRAEGACLI